jgi:hypothetical protein
VVDHDHLVEELRAEPDRQPGPLAEVGGPAHRPGADVERVEVDVRELEQRRTEHVALAVRLLDDEPVLLQRLHDPVHRGRGQAEPGPELAHAEVPRALQRAQDLRRAVDRLDHRVSSPSGVSMHVPATFSGSTLDERVMSEHYSTMPNVIHITRKVLS